MVTTMKRGFALLFLLALGGATAGASGLDGLRWLEGTWKREASHGTQYETWRILSERTFEGEAYLVGASGRDRPRGVLGWIPSCRAPC